jgi:DNA-directed RNA polymerase specialized sigma24 family protein
LVDDLKTTLERALAGDRVATSALLDAIVPIVRVRVYRSLAARARAARGRDTRQEIEDLTQDVLYRLFRDDARILRTWDAARGLSLLNFVGLVAEREVGRVMKSGRRSPWKDDPSEDDDLQSAAGTTEHPENALAARDSFTQIVSRLKEQLSPIGLEMFRLLVLEERSVEEICDACAMKPDAVYAWRSRILKRAREIAADLESKASDSSLSRATPLDRDEAK